MFFIGPKPNHCLALSVTPSLMLLRLDWCDPGVWIFTQPLLTLLFKRFLTNQTSCWSLVQILKMKFLSDPSPIIANIDVMNKDMMTTWSCTWPDTCFLGMHFVVWNETEGNLAASVCRWIRELGGGCSPHYGHRKHLPRAPLLLYTRLIQQKHPFSYRAVSSNFPVGKRQENCFLCNSANKDYSCKQL